MELAGIVGKANVGKSTLFTALTMIEVPAANFPFTTTKPNRGVTYLRVTCVCRELGVKDSPGNSLCVDGMRFVPISIIDCPGIVRGAHAGRGMGLQFLDEIRQADALIVVVDASGGTDDDGNPVQPGSHDPVEDVRMVEDEMDLWMADLLQKDWNRLVRLVETKQSTFQAEVARKMSGLRINEQSAEAALESAELDGSTPSKWTQQDVLLYVRTLRRSTKPMIIAANKADVPTSREGIRGLVDAGYDVVPCSAEAEKLLRLASKKGVLKYSPGDESFEVLETAKLTTDQRRALERVADFMARNGGTGVQRLIDKVYLEVLKYVPVFPVEDPNTLTDSKGRVLPDVYLVKEGSTPRDLAYKIHSDLGESFLYAVDARTKMRLSSDYRLKSGDVVSIVSAARR
ncbi:MAG: redox-regulated ATPase YchF [Thaumarchaeota archaeon]|nr:redox-regulated ATPase YchF [Candidatus Calditenuaceae archaeon]MDW8187041.1 redox-regulated ATPase YchF [Nitrososphaerota archaeon]